MEQIKKTMNSYSLETQKEITNKLKKYNLIKSFINLLKKYEIGFKIDRKWENENDFTIVFLDIKGEVIMLCVFDKTKQNIEYYNDLKVENGKQKTMWLIRLLNT